MKANKKQDTMFYLSNWWKIKANNIQFWSVCVCGNKNSYVSWYNFFLNGYLLVSIKILDVYDFWLSNYTSVNVFLIYIPIKKKNKGKRQFFSLRD